jgi:hydroxyethylthiazole kinase-like uncharacterized protein yjeF
MIPLCRTTAIRTLEATAFETIPPTALMEKAGLAVAQWIGQAYSNHCSVLVLAGPGNNGGDGWVIARHLQSWGYPVAVLSTPGELPPPAEAARLAWVQAKGPILLDWPQQNPELVVDALFGIGLARPPAQPWSQWIEKANALACPLIAVDMPSGLNADTGKAYKPCIVASHTLTLMAAKPGLFTRDGPDYAGNVTVLGLDVPVRAEGWLLDQEEDLKWLPARPQNSHKGSFGAVGILGGAEGMTGALLLAATGALQSGAGRVWVSFLDKSISPAALELLQNPELMTATAGDLLKEKPLSVLAVGPGMGTSLGAAQWLSQSLDFEGPLVLDADALNLLALNPDLTPRVAGRLHSTVLTPHPGEAARLLQQDSITDPIESALTLARKFNAWMVLKGCGSVLASPEGQWWINRTGNPGLSAAGMGDVLTGVIAALLAQGLSALQALQLGVFVHGAAADTLVEQGVGPRGLTASEVARAIRSILNHP